MGVIVQNSNMSQVELKPSIIENGLTFYYDAYNNASYPGSGTDIFNITNNDDIETTLSGSFSGVTVVNDHLDFDSGDRIDINENFVMSRSGATLMWWMATSTATTNQNIFSIGKGDNPYNKLIEYRQTSFYGETDTNCNNFHSPSFTAFSNNEWRHIAVKFDSNSSFWYIDGNNIGETTNYGVDTSGGQSCGDAPSTDQLEADLTLRYIGGTGGYSSPYEGQLNQIMLYNRGLSDAEVLQNFNAQRNRY